MYIIESKTEIIQRVFTSMDDVRIHLRGLGCKVQAAAPVDEPGTMVANWEAADGTVYAVWNLPIAEDSVIDGVIAEVAGTLARAKDSRLINAAIAFIRGAAQSDTGSTERGKCKKHKKCDAPTPVDTDDLTLILEAVDDATYFIGEVVEYFGFNRRTPGGRERILQDFESSGAMARAANLFVKDATEQLRELGVVR